MPTPTAPWIATSKPHGPNNPMHLVSFDARHHLDRGYCYVSGLPKATADVLADQVNLAPGLIDAVRSLAGMMHEIDKDPMPLTSYVADGDEKAAVEAALRGSRWEAVSFMVPSMVHTEIEDGDLLDGYPVATHEQPGGEVLYEVLLVDHADVIRALNEAVSDMEDHRDEETLDAMVDTIAGAKLDEGQQARLEELLAEEAARAERIREAAARG